MSMYGLNYIVLKIKKSKLGELIAMAISYELNISNIPQSFNQNQMITAKDNLIKILAESNPHVIDFDLNALNDFNKTFVQKDVQSYALPANTPNEALEPYVKESANAYSLYFPWTSKVPAWNQKSNDYNGEFHLEEMENLAYDWHAYFCIYMPELIVNNEEEIIMAGDALSQTQPFEKRKLTMIS